MHEIVLTLFVWVLIPLVYSKTELPSTCSSPSASSMHLSVDSFRNQKGNWVTKLDLERGWGRGLPDATRIEPWAVDVDSNTRTCEGSQSNLHVTITLTAPRPIRRDYELFPGLGYYKFHNNATTWELARQTCEEEGAHLAIINSEKESEVMKTLFARFSTISGSSSPDWAFIGIERSGDEFITIFGETMNSTGFMRWHPGQPHKSDIYGLVHRNGDLGDGARDTKRAFICEQEI